MCDLCDLSATTGVHKSGGRRKKWKVVGKWKEEWRTLGDAIVSDLEDEQNGAGTKKCEWIPKARKNKGIDSTGHLHLGQWVLALRFGAICGW